MAVISVIVPVYKVEPYIRRCVDSIRNQSFSDFELILVDDGSPDNCGTICDEYAEMDSRIRVIHQPNGGLSAARNAGIDWVLANSDSTWLTFIDSDDWIHPEMLERLHQMNDTFATSVSCCGFVETAGEIPVLSDGYASHTWDAKAFYMQRNVHAVIACGKLYHRECFREIRYPVGKLHEDEFVTYRILFSQENVAVTDMPLYYYFRNPDGITKSSWSPKRLDAWEAIEQQMRFFQDRNDMRMYRFCLRSYYENALVQLKNAEECSDPDLFRKERKRIAKQIKMLIRMNWKQGQIRFWDDYENLHRFYPLYTQLYRVYNAVKKRLGVAYDA